MPAPPPISLIISAYNRSSVLEKCLIAYAAQTVLPDEIIVADDGSSDPGIPDVLAAFANRFPCLKQVWHPDHGYQRSKVLNRAIREASGELLIFSDSDCVPEAHFIEDHRALCERGCFLQGSRAHVRMEHADGFKLSLARVVWLCVTNGIYNRKAAFRIPFLERFKKAGHWNLPLGANFSCWREDLVALNGFDERYEGWGGEDVDVFNRLKFREVRGVFPFWRCIIYHLDHSRWPVNPDNRERHQSELEERVVRCSLGLDGTELREPFYRYKTY